MINKHYEKLVHKQDFCRMLAFRIGVEKETVRIYLETDKIPIKHKSRIEKALDVQSKLDDKIKIMTLTAFENI